MKRDNDIRSPRPGAVALLAVLVVTPAAAQAYVGPGAGLTAIGTMLALVAALALAVVGFVWYPVKRLMRRRRPDADRDAGAAGERPLDR